MLVFSFLAMPLKMNVLLFGDQGTDYHEKLRQKLQQKNNPLLTTFLERANVAMQEEVAWQPYLMQETMPQFSSLLELVDWFGDSSKSNPAIESALCCMCQIACFIR